MAGLRMSFMDALRVAAQTKEAPKEWVHSDLPNSSSWPAGLDELGKSPGPAPVKKRHHPDDLSSPQVAPASGAKHPTPPLFPLGGSQPSSPAIGPRTAPATPFRTMSLPRPGLEGFVATPVRGPNDPNRAPHLMRNVSPLPPAPQAFNGAPSAAHADIPPVPCNLTSLTSIWRSPMPGTPASSTPIPGTPVSSVSISSTPASSNQSSGTPATGTPTACPPPPKRRKPFDLRWISAVAGSIRGPWQGKRTAAEDAVAAHSVSMAAQASPFPASSGCSTAWRAATETSTHSPRDAAHGCKLKEHVLQQVFEQRAASQSSLPSLPEVMQWGSAHLFDSLAEDEPPLRCSATDPQRQSPSCSTTEHDGASLAWDSAVHKCLMAVPPSRMLQSLVTAPRSTGVGPTAASAPSASPSATPPPARTWSLDPQKEFAKEWAHTDSEAAPLSRFVLQKCLSAVPPGIHARDAPTRCEGADDCAGSAYRAGFGSGASAGAGSGGAAVGNSGASSGAGTAAAAGGGGPGGGVTGGGGAGGMLLPGGQLGAHRAAWPVPKAPGAGTNSSGASHSHTSESCGSAGGEGLKHVTSFGESGSESWGALGLHQETSQSSGKEEGLRVDDFLREPSAEQGKAPGEGPLTQKQTPGETLLTQKQAEDLAAACMETLNELIAQSKGLKPLVEAPGTRGSAPKAPPRPAPILVDAEAIVSLCNNGTPRGVAMNLLKTPDAADAALFDWDVVPHSGGGPMDGPSVWDEAWDEGLKAELPSPNVSPTLW